MVSPLVGREDPRINEGYLKNVGLQRIDVRIGVEISMKSRVLDICAPK
jgi:hypothetical protein